MQLTDRKQAGSLLGLAELIVEQELCLNLRGRLMHCTACGDTCPADALSLTPDSVDLDETRCTGCNSCLPSCPAGALRSTAFIPERFLQALSESGQTDLHCRALDRAGEPMPGLYAVGEAAGFGGGGIHGLRSLEGTFLGGCVLGGRLAARHIARDV